MTFCNLCFTPRSVNANDDWEIWEVSLMVGKVDGEGSWIVQPRGCAGTEYNICLMSVPLGNSKLCFLRALMFLRMKSTKMLRFMLKFFVIHAKDKFIKQAKNGCLWTSQLYLLFTPQMYLWRTMFLYLHILIIILFLGSSWILVTIWIVC